MADGRGDEDDVNRMYELELCDLVKKVQSELKIASDCDSAATSNKSDFFGHRKKSKPRRLFEKIRLAPPHTSS